MQNHNDYINQQLSVEVGTHIKHTFDELVAKVAKEDNCRDQTDYRVEELIEQLSLTFYSANLGAPSLRSSKKLQEIKRLIDTFYIKGSFGDGEEEHY